MVEEGGGGGERGKAHTLRVEQSNQQQALADDKRECGKKRESGVRGEGGREGGGERERGGLARVSKRQEERHNESGMWREGEREKEMLWVAVQVIMYACVIMCV